MLVHLGYLESISNLIRIEAMLIIELININNLRFKLGILPPILNWSLLIIELLRISVSLDICVFSGRKLR